MFRAITAALLLWVPVCSGMTGGNAGMTGGHPPAPLRFAKGGSYLPLDVHWHYYVCEAGVAG